MNKKGVPVNRGLEIIYKLATRRSFRKEIRQKRISIGIPPEGFGDEKEERTTIVSGSALLCAIEILHQYHLDPAYYAEMTYYVRFNRFEEQRGRKDASVEIVYPDQQHTNNNEKAYRKLKQPYVAVYILDGSSGANVIGIIKEQWNKIQKSIKAQGGNVSDIRTTLNKVRNYLTASLREKSKAELCEMIKASTTDPAYKYKDDLIAAVMKYEYGYDISPALARKYPAKPKPKIHKDKKQHIRRYKKRPQ
jgi:hypothetical protein